MIYPDQATPELRYLAPYVEVWVALDGGQSFITMMTDGDVDVATGVIETPGLGDRVELVIRRRSGWKDERDHIVYAVSARKPVKNVGLKNE